MKKLFIAAGIIVGLIVAFLIFVTVVEYRPQAQENTEIVQVGRPIDSSVSTLKLLSWNIGYAGLDQYTDFVLDGGAMGKPRSLDAVEESLTGISSFLSSLDTDVFMIQEMDRDSSRTGGIDQAIRISSIFPNYLANFSPNYKALIVPFPFNDPIGKVYSGLLTLSKNQTTEAVRWQLPGLYDWPIRTVHLKRCAMETRFPSSVVGSDWIIINVHLTAYGDGTMRVDQLAYLKDMMMRYYSEGNFVVIGGDWNSLFPGITWDHFGPYTTLDENLGWLKVIPEDWTPKDWQWAIDPSVPSCRSLDGPYVDGENFLCLIDGFLVSPNVKIDSVKGYNLGFAYSDHNPVELQVSMK